jgi:subtilisin family serine protease
VFPAPTPAMEFYPWGIDQVGLSLVHSSRVKGQGVTVAIFDTGIDRTHPDLAPSIIGGFNAIEEATDERDYRDDNGHGTGVAGIIAARTNGMGVIGGAPKAQIFAVKVLNNKGEGHTSDVVYALNELIKRPHIRVINMSFGSSIDWTPVFGPIFPEAVKRATAAGKIIIASRGNRAKCALPVSTGATATGAGGDGAGGDGAGGDGAGGDGSGGTTLCGCSATAPVTSTGAGGDGAGGDGAGGDGAGGDGAGGDGAGGDGAGGDGTTFKFLWGCANEVKYPAAFPEVITVGATTSFGYVPMYSLSEDLDVVAPGGHGTNPVFTTNVGGGYGTIVGTSASAAHVTAAVALALSVDKDLTADQISRILKRTATPMLCGTFANPVPCGPDRQGAGQINVPAMLDAIRRLQ